MHPPRHPMKLIILSLLVLALAACGGGGKSASKLASDDVAVVGSTHVKLPLFTDLMAQAKQSFKAQGQAWPKAGTTGYQTIKGEAVTLMVQSAEREQKAAELGIVVTPKQVEARLDRAEEAVLRRQRDEVQGAAEDPGPHRRARSLRRQVADRPGEALREGDEEPSRSTRETSRPTTQRTWRRSTRSRRRATCGTSS